MQTQNTIVSMLTLQKGSPNFGKARIAPLTLNARSFFGVLYKGSKVPKTGFGAALPTSPSLLNLTD